MKPYPDTSGLQAAVAVVKALIETWRGQMSEREFECLVACLKKIVDREDASSFEDMPSSEFADFAGIVAEGTADAIFGRPANANPYASEWLSAYGAWEIGHRFGLDFLETRAASEARRWLEAA